MILKQDTIRKDYITRGILLLIKEKELNKNIKWVEFSEFKKYLKIVLNKENENCNENDIQKWIIIYVI